MYDFLSEYYLVIKSLHIISIICWMAGIFYLPRLFCYHAQVDSQSESAQLFKTMERRLLKIIINPAMIASFIFGISLMMVPGMLASPVGWLHVKLMLVMIMVGFHGFLVYCLRRFKEDNYPYSSNTFRLLNEVPPFVMIFIIFLVVIKPF